MGREGGRERRKGKKTRHDKMKSDKMRQNKQEQRPQLYDFGQPISAKDSR